MSEDRLRDRLSGFNTINTTSRQTIFMSYDDVPDDFLDKLEDGLTSDEIEEELDQYDLPDGSAEDAISDLERMGYEVDVEMGDEGGAVWYAEEPDPEFSHVETRRMGSKTQSTVTRNVNQFMAEEERMVNGYREEMDFDEYVDATHSPGSYDQLIHVSDLHMGDFYQDERGNVTYDTDIAVGMLGTIVGRSIDEKERMEAAGEDVENAIMLLGGDMVTNEAIYNGQAHELDEGATVREQVRMAAGALMDSIETVSDNYDHVKVVCQHGNHGEFRIDGSSSDANADDLLYDRLEMVLQWTDGLDNVKFVQSNMSEYVNFDIRGGKHKGHMRHGDNVLQHIGTSAGQKRWYAHLQEHDFDIGFRGHYHTHKREPIHGKPVFEAPSPAPGDEFSEKIGAHSDDDLIGYTISSSDDHVVEHKTEIYKN